MSSFPISAAGDEENFRALHKEKHKSTWGAAIPAKVIYTQQHGNWDVFAATFTHQAFLLSQLKAIYDNLDVVLRVLAEKQKEFPRDHGDFYSPPPPPPPPRFIDDGLFGSKREREWVVDGQVVAVDPFVYFLDGNVDYTLRKVFLELFAGLATDRRDSRKGSLWREIGREILENAFDGERGSLVERLTSQGSAAELNGISGATAQAAIWRVRRQLVVRESAMQKALARLRELLEEDKKKAATAEFEWGSRARYPRRVRSRERSRDRSWERSVLRSPVRDRRVDFCDEIYTLREKRGVPNPPQSDGESVEFVDKHVVEEL